MCLGPRRTEKHHPSTTPYSPKAALRGHLMDWNSTHQQTYACTHTHGWHHQIYDGVHCKAEGSSFSGLVYLKSARAHTHTHTPGTSQSSLLKCATPKVCNLKCENDGWQSEMRPFFLHFSLHPRSLLPIKVPAWSDFTWWTCSSGGKNGQEKSVYIPGWMCFLHVYIFVS